jgi:hypothetical protein
MSVGIGQSSGITRIYVLFYTCKWFLEKLKIEDCDKEHRPLRKSFNVPLSVHGSKQRKPSPVERVKRTNVQAFLSFPVGTTGKVC